MNVKNKTPKNLEKYQNITRIVNAVYATLDIGGFLQILRMLFSICPKCNLCLLDGYLSLSFVGQVRFANHFKGHKSRALVSGKNFLGVIINAHHHHNSFHQFLSLKINCFVCGFVSLGLPGSDGLRSNGNLLLFVSPLFISLTFSLLFLSLVHAELSFVPLLASFG